MLAELDAILEEQRRGARSCGVIAWAFTGHSRWQYASIPDRVERHAWNLHSGDALFDAGGRI